MGRGWGGDIQGGPRSPTWPWREVNRREEAAFGSAGLHVMCSLVEMSDKHLDVPGYAGSGASTAERWGLKS